VFWQKHKTSYGNVHEIAKNFRFALTGALFKRIFLIKRFASGAVPAALFYWNFLKNEKKKFAL
jgi:hypothetical protein